MAFTRSAAAVGAVFLVQLAVLQNGADGSCLQDLFDANGGKKQGLVCTAKEVNSIALEFSGVENNDVCQGPDDTINLHVNLQGHANADRYDLALVAAVEDDVDPQGSGACQVTTFGRDETYGADLDSDACADVVKGDFSFDGIAITARCTAAAGGLSLPYCVSWRQNKNCECSGPDEAGPGTPSKCYCDDDFVLPGVCVINIKEKKFDTSCCPDSDGYYSQFKIPKKSVVASSSKDLTWTVTNSDNSKTWGPSDAVSCKESKVSRRELGSSKHGKSGSGSKSCNYPSDNICLNLPVDDVYTFTVFEGTEGDTVNSYTCKDEITISTKCGGGYGDPHLVGFEGQRFDFTGESGAHYALLADEPSTVVTMQVHAPVPELPVITYITGVGIVATDTDGETHTIHIVVDEPDEFYAPHSCPTSEPCLAEGVLSVLLDGESMDAPGVVELGPGVFIGAANIPGECRPFGFEKYWAQKVREAQMAAAAAAGDGRRLRGVFRDMASWIMDDPLATNKLECLEYVERAEADGSLFEHQGEHTSFEIVTPQFTMRLNHGKLHQVAMRDPTDQFDLPDHRTYQLNLALESVFLEGSLQGILGGTATPTVDASGQVIMEGFEAFLGSEEDYRVSGPFDADFALNRAGDVESA